MFSPTTDQRIVFPHSATSVSSFWSSAGALVVVGLVASSYTSDSHSEEGDGSLPGTRWVPVAMTPSRLTAISSALGISVCT